MKRTRPGTIGLLALIGGLLAWMIDVGLQSAGRPILVPGLTLAPTLLVIAIVLLAVAWPIRRYTRWLRAQEEARGGGEQAPDAAQTGDPASDADRGSAPKRPDPFVAMRVLALAKASSAAGAVLLGGCLAILAFVASRSFVVVEQASLAGIGAAGAAILLAAGILAESWCALPPDARGGAAGRATPALD